jgi:hypothetical protein
MGRILTITNSNDSSFGVKKKTIKPEIIIGPNAIKFVAVAVFAILALIFLTQSTAGVNRSVEVRDLNTTESNLKERASELQVEAQRLRSLGEIEKAQTEDASANQVDENKLEPISQIEHIGGEGSLARN